jgi:SAM-dependent methyltransferase
MRTAEYPRFDAPEVVEVADQLRAWATAKSRLNGFLRGYYGSSVSRLAMNVVMLRRLIRPGTRWLDVGSFGIESAILKRDVPDAEYQALSFEGNRIALGDEGLYESADPDDPRAVLIQQVDIEKAPFPYLDASFDLVTCFEVLEHLKLSPVPMAKEIRRVLASEGCMVLTTPNPSSPGMAPVRSTHRWPSQSATTRARTGTWSAKAMSSI